MDSRCVDVRPQIDIRSEHPPCGEHRGSTVRISDFLVPILRLSMANSLQRAVIIRGFNLSNAYCTCVYVYQ